MRVLLLLTLFVMVQWPCEVLSSFVPDNLILPDPRGCGLCLCTFHNSDVTVDCSGRNLTELPTGLPGKATQIDLSNNSIAILPVGAFAPFSSLQHLDLSWNQLGVFIPLAADMFNGLGGLLSLNLAHNNLSLKAESAASERHSNDMSSESLRLAKSVSWSPFVHLESLERLDLSHNVISSNVSSDVFRGLNANLNWLDLSYNTLGGGLGSSPASELTKIDNSMTPVNSKSDSLNSSEWHDSNPGSTDTELDSSNVSDFELDDSSTGSLPVLPCNLSFLDLSYNALTGLDELAFEGLIHLTTLNLSHNHIPSTSTAYPPGVFTPVSASLQMLRVEGNCDGACFRKHKAYPDRALSVLSSVRVLHMDGYENVNLGPGFRNMTSLLTLSLSGLSGSYCSLRFISNDTFLHAPDTLSKLHISDCNISKIDTGAFQPLRHLDFLDVSENIDLGFDRFGEAVYGLQGSSLRELHINAIMHPYAMCVLLSPDNTRYFRNTGIEIIYARTNRMEVFLETALTNMPPTLRLIHVDENRLGFGGYFKDFSSLTNVKEIYNDGFRVALSPPKSYPPKNMQRCRPQEDVLQPDNEDGLVRELDSGALYLSEFGNAATGLDDSSQFAFNLPPNLQTYVSRWNKLYYRLEDITFNSSNSLTELNLSNNLLTAWIGPIRGLNKLRKLDLANNFAFNVSIDFFRSFPTLTAFNGSRNSLRVTIQQDVDGKLFEPLGNLEQLDLSKNSINVIPADAFKGLGKLQALRLAYNEIFQFDVNVSHMMNLTLLDLAYNNIHYLPQHIMDHLDSVALHAEVHVDMTFNSIACTCQHVSFLTWIKESRVKFHPKTNLDCLMSNGDITKGSDILVMIDDLKRTCVGTDNFNVFVAAAACCFCLLVAITSAILYRFRWRLRYLYYASRLAYRRQDNHEDDDRFLYDAFVSYTSEDEDFVRGELMTELEGRAGLRVNVHFRDFTPGRPIPSNIVEAVQCSRRTLVVLSRQWLQSDWCRYEIQMANMEDAHSGRDVLLFLLYEPVSSDVMSREILYNLQTSTYIDYPQRGDPQLLRDFWDRLAQAIKQ